MSDQMIQILADKTGVMAQNGPMGITIQAWKSGKPDLEMVLDAAEFSFECLNQVARHHKDLKQHPSSLPDNLESIPMAMVKSVMATGEKDLTPMAAVAGSIADSVADRLFYQGMTRVIVNNGGDIAIRLDKDETVRVGIRTDVRIEKTSHLVELSSHNSSWGVNTSGLGGRSLTRGIASAVTAFAGTSSLADAAATSIANACYVEDDSIIQTMAEKIDPLTDIRGIPVTIKVGQLKKESITRAVKKALNRAHDYMESGIIKGALIAVEKQLVLTNNFFTRVAALQL